jgi:hypothetical protein
MESMKQNPAARGIAAKTWLPRSAAAWYGAAFVGQLLFILFILAFYYPSSLGGDFAAWDNKPNITGFVAGDRGGNLMFASHVMIAAVMTAAGLIQLLPVVRRRWPRLHRVSGRIFLTTALLLAAGGLWLTWGRGSMLTLTGGIGITFNALLIFCFAAMAWRTAVARRFVDHRRWALRFFIAANGVWFMRLGYIIWGIGTGGAGIGEAMDGPFDYFLAFGNVLVPLALLEIYMRVEAKGAPRARRFMAAGLGVAALLTLAGGIGAWFAMWSPYI